MQATVNDDTEKTTGETTPFNGFVTLVLPAVAGGGTSLQRQFTEPWFGGPAWSGNALLIVIGLAGLVWTAKRARSSHVWAAIVGAMLVDELLTELLLRRSADAVNPLAFWPYLLGTTLTFVTAIGIGCLLRSRATLRVVAVGWVSLAFALGGAAGFLAMPLPLSGALTSRVVVAYCAAIAGVAVGAALRRFMRRAGTWSILRKEVVLPLVLVLLGAIIEQAIERLF